MAYEVCRHTPRHVPFHQLNLNVATSRFIFKRQLLLVRSITRLFVPASSSLPQSFWKNFLHFAAMLQSDLSDRGLCLG